MSYCYSVELLPTGLLVSVGRIISLLAGLLVWVTSAGLVCSGLLLSPGKLVSQDY